MTDWFWSVVQRSNALQDFRQSLRGLWNDSAAHEINQHYLDPHRQDNVLMQQMLSQLIDALTDAEGKLDAAEQEGMRAERLSQQVKEYLGYAEHDRSEADRDHGRFLTFNAEAQEELPIISDLIETAKQYCS